MEVQYLPIKKEKIKYRPFLFAINLEGNNLIFRISWNPVAEAFFFDLFDRQKNSIIKGRKIVYGQNMLSNIIDKRLPNLQIVPLDPAGDCKEKGITFNNFMNQIKPYLLEIEDDN